MNRIKKVLVANRGEIVIRIFRACNELGIRTVAIYSQEDVLSLHRYKADEAYLIGEGKGPVEAYLDIEGIIKIAKENDVDAVHPGYGFLSENAALAKRCAEENLIFIGPELRHLIMFGDKINAREQAKAAGIPMIPGSDGPVSGLEEVKAFARQHGFPLIIKAVSGGGGRGMRIVNEAASLEEAYQRARSEAKAAFGSDEVYLEKLLAHPKHIEVQILGDRYGNIVHLFERDCSVQRRHQKLVEVAPAVGLPDSLRREICDAAVKLMKKVGYVNAGTVEFLVTPDNKFYFIEVNPRIQVEHTITEMITGRDIVQAQLLIADGLPLGSEEIGIPSQEAVHCHGHAIQCRVTTEDAANNFRPDTGKIVTYRSGGGFGVRLDAGNAYSGSVITPYYDSLLVKASTLGLTRKAAIAKMKRCLEEFRVRGVKTNIPFLKNVISHEKFLYGTYDTAFVDTSPELFVFTPPKDRATKVMKHLGNIIVNGYEGLGRREKPVFPTPRMPQAPCDDIPAGSKQILEEKGVDGLIAWVKEQKKVLLTDTTLRDAHQSLLATRMRTYDMVKVIDPTVRLLPNLFSLEMWGGATFDVAYRFLREDPWERLAALRAKTPNILFQMLLRSANAVGYTNYPDNVVRHFIAQSAAAGIDVFRIFDSLNWLESMRVAIEAVRDAGKVAEASLCYTGDILDPRRSKYDLDYYVTMAKELEKAGTHILGIKDMAGLLKPEAAYRLVTAIKEAVSVPVHLHCHDTSGNGIYTYARAIDAGVDIVDVAISSLAGSTSQPSANSLYYALSGHERQPDVGIRGLTELSHYWEDVRSYYTDFDSKLFFPNPEVYEHEMPGGQYSNFKQQAKALGLEGRWEEVKVMYRRVNDMFGDIIKVTPSSKVVGDMALFMVENSLTEENIYEKGELLSFPQSVIEFFEGQIGQPYQGFPPKLQTLVLKGRKPITCRPGELLPPAEFAKIREVIEPLLERPVSEKDLSSYALYPKVFTDWLSFIREYGDVSLLDTPTAFYGMLPGEEIRVDIEQGKTLYIKLLAVGSPNAAGERIVGFELNGLLREIVVRDKSVKAVAAQRTKVDPANPEQVGASMSGTVVKILVEKGTKVKKGTPLIATEAMKMETSIQAPIHGFVKEIYVKPGEHIETGDLLLSLERPPVSLADQEEPKKFPR
ncbi:pyruvate carboxylase [Anaeroselena agilis]|uniref:Pyruvate carboxylase n=1 Tax=Anaeroselena agilis TaxID=3063788 RepID=A0ABU3P5R6_9FIRM|nr:pyruvate carboxylase [Selenomonadales bacterium 4137-cl]